MTSLLLEAGADLTVFEIDRGFVQLLTSYFGSYHSFHLIEGDVLKTWKTEYQRYAPKAFLGIYRTILRQSSSQRQSKPSVFLTVWL